MYVCPLCMAKWCEPIELKLNIVSFCTYTFVCPLKFQLLALSGIGEKTKRVTW